MGFKTGQHLDDGSFYMQGYNIFNCKNLTEPVFTSGEVELNKIDTIGKRINIRVLDYLPIKSGWKFSYTQVIKYEIVETSNIIKVIGPDLILDLADLSDADVTETFQSLGWVNANPEVKLNVAPDSLEIMIYKAFIIAVKYHPKYKILFNNLGPYDGAMAELYSNLKSYYSILE